MERNIRTKEEGGEGEEEEVVHGRREEEERGEGDATRLINRHADNHSGFMVTTDYQVVQGGIFHIRDVTLFQWGNTCSARYKLHERAYTGRHVCCLRILRSPSLHPLSFPSSQVCTYRGIYVHIRTDGSCGGHTGSGPRRHGTGSKRRPHALSLFPFFFIVFLYLLDPPLSARRAPFISIPPRHMPFSQNHSHVRRSAPTKVAGHFSERPIP